MINFPKEHGFLTPISEQAFNWWTDNELDPPIVKFMASQFTPQLVELSHCVNDISIDGNKSFPSLTQFLVCVLFHRLPPNAYGHIQFNHSMIASINCAFILWNSGLVPLFNGLTWQLWNDHTMVLEKNKEMSFGS